MRKIVFLFPGGGAQVVGMMKDICATYSEAQEIFYKADKILGRSISAMTFEGDEHELSSIHNMQPCMLTAEIAAYSVLRSLGVMPSSTAGLSLGEWSALVASNVLSSEIALKLSQLRADYMLDAAHLEEGGMAVIFGKTEKQVVDLCNKLGGLSPSNYTCPGQITVSGKISSIKKLMEMKEKEELAAHQVAVDVPSHCELMRPAAEKLASDIQKIDFMSPNVHIVMNATGEITTDPNVIKHNLIQQLVLPVRFQQSIELMLSHGADTFIEIGPGDVLARFVTKISKSINADVDVYNVMDIASLNDTLLSLNSNQENDN